MSSSTLGSWTGLIPAHAGKTDDARDGYAARRAHPRSRGENRRRRSRGSSTLGSSPLTRGKRREVGSQRRNPGLIPAHAGKTRIRASVSSVVAAHPRSRGENGVVARHVVLPLGSSPLTRGKRRRIPARTGGRGLIPAHAGKTPSRRSRTGQTRAHPRSRGENISRASALSAARGSSPLTRGKLHNARAALRADGLIPAHAGKTAMSSSMFCSIGAHPRSRGENASLPARPFPI